MPSPHCEHVNCEYPAVKHLRREEFALWLRMGKDTFALLHHSLDIELCFKSENCNFKLDIIKKSKNDTWAPWYWERANFPSIYWELGRFIDDHQYFYWRYVGCPSSFFGPNSPNRKNGDDKAKLFEMI